MERTECATSGQAKKKDKRMRGRKKREREEPDLKRREEVKVAIVMEVCCKSKNGSWLRGKKSQEL